MEGLFNITPTNGMLPIKNGDLTKYLTEKEGVLQLVKFKDFAKSTEKERSFAFLFGPTMSCAVDGFTAQGYEGMDKVKARYLLESMFCKAEAYNPKTGKVSVYTESVAHMGIKRLHKFIGDVLFFLEAELGQRVPDAEAFKKKVSTGRDYESVKNIKE